MTEPSLTFNRRSEQYKFEDWRLAFEVDLKMEEHEQLASMSATWSTTFQDSFVFKHHGRSEDRVLKHIYLDLPSMCHIIICVDTYLTRL